MKPKRDKLGRKRCPRCGRILLECTSSGGFACTNCDYFVSYEDAW